MYHVRCPRRNAYVIAPTAEEAATDFAEKWGTHPHTSVEIVGPVDNLHRIMRYTGTRYEFRTD